MNIFEYGEVNEFELRAWALDRVSADLIARERIKEAQVLFDWVMKGGEDGAPM